MKSRSAKNISGCSASRLISVVGKNPCGLNPGKRLVLDITRIERIICSGLFMVEMLSHRIISVEGILQLHSSVHALQELAALHELPF